MDKVFFGWVFERYKNGIAHSLNCIVKASVATRYKQARFNQVRYINAYPLRFLFCRLDILENN